MEPIAAVSGLASWGRRTTGWQVQLRVDHVVNTVTHTHRGRSEDAVRQALQDQLRAIGAPTNGRQIAQYAAAIAQLPPLPPHPDRQ